MREKYHHTPAHRQNMSGEGYERGKQLVGDKVHCDQLWSV